ncbi:MAG TPA: GntR family transcriptional regulator [Solirubrobacterales bacterium]|nr:GntR family transcriptional regulator [Solirubrobacterales bacterium]
MSQQNQAGAAIEPESAHERVAATLRKRVQLGIYEPDERLPPTREFAEQLGVARVTLQQAINLLAEEGFLRTRRGRGGGTFVVASRGRGRPRKVSPDQVADLRANYEFRLQIEPFVARMAAERASAEQRGHLVSEASRAATTVASFRANDTRFHMLLAEACGNAYAKDAIEQTRTGLFAWLDRLWAQLTDKAKVSEAEHMGIALAVLRGDADEAERLMAQHLEVAADNLTRALTTKEKGQDR